MPSLFDMDYGTVRKGTGRLSGREAPRETPSLWDYINAVSMTPVPGVSDVAAGLLAAKDFREGNYGSGALNAAGVLPFVPALGGIFKGVKGATKSEKQALLKAQQMAREGADRDTIWNATLWYKGKDGKWRTEISDEAARVQPDAVLHRAIDKQAVAEGAPTSFPQWVYMDHPQAYSAYPDAKNIAVRPTGDMSGGASYDEASNMISLSAFSQNPKSSNLHELQHAIQQREGMARGGSPEMFAGDTISRGLSSKRLLDDIDRSGAMDFAKFYENGKFSDLQEAASAYTKFSGKTKDQAEDAALAFWNYSGQSKTTSGLMDRIQRAQETVDTMFTSPEDIYKRLLGEVDARNTQKRMDMTLDQRRQSPPWSTWDVPEADQIVRFGDGPAMSIADTSMDDLAAQLEAMRAANKAKGLPVETGTGDLRGEIARRNAVGLLGLPETNTAADRARAMGFDTDAYHGTADTFVAPDMYAEMYSSNLPDIASRYSDYAQRKPNIYGELGQSPNVMPLKVRSTDLVEDFKGNKIYKSSAPNIRSRFAAFDPARRDEADLLAGLLPYAIPAGLLGMFLTRPGEGYE